VWWREGADCECVCVMLMDVRTGSFVGSNSKAGNWVQILDLKETEKTLDSDCMASLLCPRWFNSVAGVSECFDAQKRSVRKSPAVSLSSAHFYKKDIAVLDGLRCSGLSHDGCQWLGPLLWKIAWLRSAVGDLTAEGS
jgi:hypothetical protein